MPRVEPSWDPASTAAWLADTPVRRWLLHPCPAHEAAAHEWVLQELLVTEAEIAAIEAAHPEYADEEGTN